MDARSIRVNGVDLTYSSSGHGEDVLFLFHGVTANHRVWSPIAETLARKFRVIAVDQRGHGRSGTPVGEYTAEAYSDDIRGLIEALGGAGCTILVGHSLGSRNAIVAAARYGDHIDGIVAIDFTPFIEEEVFDTLEARVVSGDRTFSSMSQIEEYLHGRYPKLPLEAIRRRAAYGYESGADGYRALADPGAMRQTVRGLRADLATPTRHLSVPAVFVRGAESALVTEQAFARTKALRPDLDYVVVEHADHYVPEEQPGAIIEIIEKLAEQSVPKHTGDTHGVEYSRTRDHES